MRIKFISSLLTVAAMVALAFSAPAAKAQKANIQVPFDFKVGDQVWPAGAYVVKRDVFGNQIVLSNSDETLYYKWIAVHTNQPSKNGLGQLTFDSVGSQHVLQSVQIGSQSTARLYEGTLRPRQGVAFANR